MALFLFSILVFVMVMSHVNFIALILGDYFAAVALFICGFVFTYVLVLMCVMTFAVYFHLLLAFEII